MATSTRRRGKPAARIVLVKGVFDPSDAHHLLSNLISYKIGFHEMKQFSDMERLGRRDEYSARRIRELTAARRRLMPLLRKAVQRGESLRIDATLAISSSGAREKRAGSPRRDRTI